MLKNLSEYPAKLAKFIIMTFYNKNFKILLT